MDRNAKVAIIVLVLVVGILFGGLFGVAYLINQEHQTTYQGTIQSVGITTSTGFWNGGTTTANLNVSLSNVPLHQMVSVSEDSACWPTTINPYQVGETVYIVYTTGTPFSNGWSLQSPIAQGCNF